MDKSKGVCGFVMLFVFVFGCGRQHGKVKRCVRFCDVVGYVLCSVLGLFIWLSFFGCLWWLS